jgi:hypothetical protein
MQSFHAINLLIPGDPEKLSITAPSGSWALEQVPAFAQAIAAITGTASHRPKTAPVAETYFIESAVGMDVGAALAEGAFEELTPILLGATYATGLSATIERSTMGSDVTIVQSSEHWPRARALGGPAFVVTTAVEYKNLVERFLASWPSAGRTEKALLLIHHWLDALSCWSMEDLYLSATTLMQVIVATEARKQGKDKLEFYPGITAAAQRFGIASLSAEFKNMRNELVHDGQLIGARFAGPDKLACANVVADVLNWIDAYIHAALALGPVLNKRFKGTSLVSLNAYSIY